MLFSNWGNLARVLITGVLAYAGLIVFLRISGKRTLSKMNAFDLVVTVALGSTLATVLLPSDAALSDGLLALALLIGLQFAIASLQVRSAGFRRLVKSEPTLLFHRGEFLVDVLRQQRVAPDEVLAAIRSSGAVSIEDIHAVVLETDGSFSVLSPPHGQPGRSSLSNVEGSDTGMADHCALTRGH